MKRIVKLDRRKITRAHDLGTACEQIGDLAKFEFLEQLKADAYFFAKSKGNNVEFCFAHWEDGITVEFRMTLDDAIKELVEDINRPSEHKEAETNWQNLVFCFETALRKLKAEHLKYLSSNNKS